MHHSDTCATQILDHIKQTFFDLRQKFPLNFLWPLVLLTLAKITSRKSLFLIVTLSFACVCLAGHLLQVLFLCFVDSILWWHLETAGFFLHSCFANVYTTVTMTVTALTKHYRHIIIFWYTYYMLSIHQISRICSRKLSGIFLRFKLTFWFNIWYLLCWLP